MENTTVRDLVDVFQESQRKGEFARLFLETRNGIAFVNFSAHLPAGPSAGKENGKKKMKSPSSRRRDAARLQAWRDSKDITSDKVENHEPDHNDSIMDSENCDVKTSSEIEMIENSIDDLADDSKEVPEEKADECEEKSTDESKVVPEDNKDEMKEETATTMERKSSDSSEEEEWIPPEYINCIKFFMDEFKNAEIAEEKIRKILDDNDIKIKRLKVLHNSQNQFRKMFGIEIEDHKHNIVEDLKDSLRKNEKGINLDIKYFRTIENIDDLFLT